MPCRLVMYTQRFHMSPSEDKSGKLTWVAKCFYRFPSAGMYYAVIRHDGKLFRRSLATTVRATANRKLCGRTPEDHVGRQANWQGHALVALRGDTAGDLPASRAYLASALEINPVLRLIDGMSPGLTVGPGGVYCVLMPMRRSEAQHTDGRKRLAQPERSGDRAPGN